jgi:hypothetical protein
VPCVLFLAAALVCGAGARSRLLALPPAARGAAFLLTAGVLSVGAAVAVGLARGADAANAFRYLLPALGPLALGSALVLVAATGAALRPTRVGLGAARWARLGLGVACVGWVLRARGRPSAVWSLDDAAKVTPALLARAPTEHWLRDHLRTRSRTLLGALALFHGHGSPDLVDAQQDLVLLKASNEKSAPPGPWFAEIDLGASRALLGAVRPFVDRNRMQACYAPLEGPAEDGGCVPAGLERSAEEGEPISAEEQAYPESRQARHAFPPEVLRRFGGVHERFVARVAPRLGTARVIVLLAEDLSWTIEAVSGVAYAGDLPARRVTLEGREGEGTLVLGRRTPKGVMPRDRYFPPATMEVDAKDALLADAIEAGWLE